MKLQQLIYFHTICKYRNLSRASEELHVSQPALTAAMKALEDEFGVALFYRRSKGMEPTEAGTLLLRRADELLEHAGRVEREMKNYGREHAVLRIGVAPMNETVVFPRLFQRMRERYPGITLEMTEVGSLRSLTMLKGDALDACVISGDAALPAGLCSCELMTLPFAFCTWPDHPLAGRECVTLEEIGRYPLTLLGEGTYLTSYLLSRFADEGITPQIAMKTNQLTMIGQLIRDEVSSSVLLPGILAEDAQVVRLPIEGLRPVRIFLAWKDVSPLSYPLVCLTQAAQSLRDQR